MRASASISGASEADLFIDRWLRFPKDLDRQYEADHHDVRVKHLRETLWLGLSLYNAHNITNHFLMPDIIWLTLFLRVLVVTPVALLAIALFSRVTPSLREGLAFLVVAGAFASEAIFFSMSHAELGNYAFSEFGLTLVFGCVLLALRFRHAVIFTALCCAIASGVLWTKPDLPDSLRLAFVIQIAMACIISLYGNYTTERRRCYDYVIAHLAVLQARQSEAAKQHFEGQSKTDPLTGLPNRRSFDDDLARWLDADELVAVMMIDIDHFKLLNDTLGHQVGDACLARIGQFLATLRSPQVLCARYGGEEFILAVRSFDEQRVAQKAGGLVRAIEDLGIPHPGRSQGPSVVTASVGLAIRHPGETGSAADLLMGADRALYRAKRRGRNRFEQAEPALLAAG